MLTPRLSSCDESQSSPLDETPWGGRAFMTIEFFFFFEDLFMQIKGIKR